MAGDRSARRLYPRLRVLGDGSSEVNACRSDISTTVVSTNKALQQRADVFHDMVDLAGVQGSVQTLEATAFADRPSRLGRRRSHAEGDEADDAFVNVFIEVLPEVRAERPSETLVDSLHGIEDALRQHDAVRGTCVRRENLISATVPISKLSDLTRDPRISFVSGSESLKLDVPVATRSGRPRSRKVSGRRRHRNGEGVIIGVIDVGGFDFAHPDFLDREGRTRFLSIWDQGGDFRQPPDGFDYGSEFRSDHLQRAIDESAATGFPASEWERQSQRREASHGTHVASIAAGNRGVCPAAQIAAVLIDVPVPEDLREHRQFSFADSSRIAHAVEYLLDVADREGKPISINISLGTNGGAHDGSNGVNRWLDHALTTPGRAICVAAGNAGQEAPVDEFDIGWTVGRIHTSGRVESRGLEVELEWTVVGNGIADLSENELEIWYGPQDRFIASVRPPGDDRWYEVKPQQFRENTRLSDGTHLSIYNELYHPHNGANYIAIYLSPNLDPENIRGVRAGVWRVRLRGDEVRDGRFHAWIERDDPVEIGQLAGQRLFRFPSFFSVRSNVDSHSISSLACGRHVIAVANTDAANARVNITSSQGPTRDNRFKPEIAAPGTNISAAKGFSLDEDEWIEMSGTSMASPYVAGVIGLMLAANPELNAAQCNGILQRTAQPLPGQPFEWQSDSGFGQIDPDAAIREAASFTERTERRN